VSAAEGQATVDDVGQLQLAHLFAGQGVEGDQGNGDRDRGVRRVELSPDHGGVERQRDVGGDRGGVESLRGVGEDEPAALEDLEQGLPPERQRQP